ncbi:PRKCA-binding protein [Geodia barretti]|uniref:PRKCA-binding protein n=1 Tax=Geodia barretti TaxID=519541 RepID=A0AA35T3F1_GEOBA|nr:PRKCA-binding protein [Geodia barretti]
MCLFLLPVCWVCPALKKVKHRLVEKMKDSTADTLGLSRAVLVNDKLVKKVQYLENNARVYRGIAEKARGMLSSLKAVVEGHKELGAAFSNIGVYEPQQSASVAFVDFGNAHKLIGEEGEKLASKIGPMLKDLYTYLQKAVPDTKLTLKKYSDSKFEFLAYCLKVKEMDDEEYEAATFVQPLGRVLAGNYEYRMFLRCRHAAKLRFVKLRSDVLVKLQLLDNKRVQDVAFQLERLVGGMYVYNRQCYNVLKQAAVFPIEVQLSIHPPTPPAIEGEGEGGGGDEGG